MPVTSDDSDDESVDDDGLVSSVNPVEPLLSVSPDPSYVDDAENS